MGPVSPNNVHETGVSPGGKSGSPIVAPYAEQVERTRRKTWSRARSEVLVPLQAVSTAHATCLAERPVDLPQRGESKRLGFLGGDRALATTLGRHHGQAIRIDSSEVDG
jgi:hypothetical protein